MLPNLDRPCFSADDAKDFLQQVYGVNGILSSFPSERDQNFLVSLDGKPKYVLKFASADDSWELLDFQNKALEHLVQATSDFDVPRVVRSKTGDLICSISGKNEKRYYARLLTYVPGRVMAEVKRRDSSFLQSFGSFLGVLSRSLEGFTHPASRRDFIWDLAVSPKVATANRELLSSEQREIVDYFLQLFEQSAKPEISNLRTSVAYNDANDYNVLVSLGSTCDPRFGLIDFGDMLHTYTVSDLAIGIAYAILDMPDPLLAASIIVGSYNQQFQLTEAEIRALFPLICMRLVQSVCISAAQRREHPDDAYLRISEGPAWRTLMKLREIHPELAWYAFRDACDLDAHPNITRIKEWLIAHQKEFARILDVDTCKYTVIDLSVSSAEYGSPDELTDIQGFAQIIRKRLEETDAKVGIGRYAEERLFYIGDQYMTPSNEPRTIHLGIDLFTDTDTKVNAPLDGKVHSIGHNDLPFDNGPTLVLEHEISKDLKFYTLYAHLDPDSIANLRPGSQIVRGQELCRVGEYPTNGGWPSHLHFQVILDMLDFKGDYYGICSPSQRSLWTALCPDPNLLIGLPPEMFPSPPLSKDEILRIRNAHFGRNLSVSYDKPLKIVRGHMQYLYDSDGRRYLDVVNNVPTVGHSHPKVVKAIHEQAKILYTNTRYLHDNLARYIERLCALFPEPLSVCFLVNSGSEANELAIRLAKAHTKRSGFIALEGGYHGNTDNLIGLSHYKHSGPGGEGPPPNVEIVPNADIFRSPYKKSGNLGKRHADDVLTGIRNLSSREYELAAFICEPLMGCAGQIVFPPDYLRNVYRYVREEGGICIADEVQVGFGRMGSHFWGFETQGVIPDIVTLGKPIGNGHPMGAVITTPEIAASFDNGMEFFSTTGGNPVSCAVGMAVLDAIEEDNLQRNALEVGEYFKRELNKLQRRHPLIGDVRGIGLFLGVELVKPDEGLLPAAQEAHYIVNRMREEGVLLSIDGLLHNVLKIKPPLCFSKDNVDLVVSTLDDVLSELQLDWTNH